MEGAAGTEVTQALIDSAFFGPAKQYVRWDTGLHEVFVAAVEELGGAHAAKPAVIRERMGISLLTTAQVKSHLQKYRIRVVAEGKASDAATEAQARLGRARAAARLLARQRRPGEGLAQPARPRGAVPIRGSRQANAAAAAGGSAAAPAKRQASRSSGGRRKRRKAASSRSAWSDDDEEDLELEAALEAEEEEEGRSEQLSAGSEEAAGEGRGSGEEGRSAGTTSASPGARSRGTGRAPLLRATQQESDAALQLEQLVERLTGKDSAPDAATVAGLAARRDNLMAAAAAAAAALGPPVPQQPRQPAAPQHQQQQQHSYIEVKQEAPAMAGDLAAGLAAASGSSMLSASTAAAAMQRQAALEQALLEQSMWVQKLAAEVQDLRVWQQLGLPPLAPAADNSFASPFAALSQAAFPGGAGPESGAQASGPPQHRASTATVATGGPTAPSANTNNLLTCDSALLRLLSTTLGGGSLLPNDPAAAAAVAAATAGLQQSGGMPPAAQPPSQQQSQQLSQQQRQQQQQQSLATLQPSLQSLQLPPLPAPSNNLLTCDSTLLRLLSQSLGATMPPPPPSGLDASSSMAAALLGGIGGFDMQAALAAAAASMGAPFGAPAPAPQPPSNISPFAALTAQAMGPPPPQQGGMPAALQAAAAAAARPGMQGGGATANRQSSLEVLNNMLGLPGPGRAASIPLAAEFLRLCSLPLGADVLPPPPAE